MAGELPQEKEWPLPLLVKGNIQHYLLLQQQVVLLSEIMKIKAAANPDLVIYIHIFSCAHHTFMIVGSLNSDGFPDLMGGDGSFKLSPVVNALNAVGVAEGLRMHLYRGRLFMRQLLCNFQLLWDMYILNSKVDNKLIKSNYHSTIAIKFVRDP